MKLLAIETSTALATIAFSIDGQIFETQIEGVREHARILLPMVDELLKPHNVTIADLDGIVFGQGPGSFTGIRIATAAALGLGFSHQLPLYPVITTDAIAYAARKRTNLPLLCVQDARMSELYWGVYHDETTQTPQVSAPSQITLRGEGPVVVAGFGYEQYNKLFSKELLARLLEQHTIFPTAGIMIEMVQAGLIEAKGVAEAEPLYVRNQVIQGAKGG